MFFLFPLIKVKKKCLYTRKFYLLVKSYLTTNNKGKQGDKMKNEFIKKDYTDYDFEEDLKNTITNQDKNIKSIVEAARQITEINNVLNSISEESKAHIYTKHIILKIFSNLIKEIKKR